MDHDFRIGDKVIGLESWYSNPYVGTVLLTDLAKFDPLHELLINTSNKDISLSSISEYKQKLNELYSDTKMLSLRLTIPYSPRTHKKLTILIRFMNGRLAKGLVSYEMVIYKFFDKGLNVFLLKISTYTRLSLTFIFRHLTNFLLGTIELLLGDIWKFYRRRLEIGKVKQQLRIETRKMHRAEYFWGFASNEKDAIVKRYQDKLSKINAELKRLTSEKTDISRAFIAMLIAAASLIISIIALKS